jgi:hypothetical protein
MGVEANATSSTTIVVKWGDVPREHQNGQIEGFKVYYGSNPRLPFQVCRFIVNVMISMWHPFDIHGFVHRRRLNRHTNKMQLCNRIS